MIEITLKLKKKKGEKKCIFVIFLKVFSSALKVIIVFLSKLLDFS